MELQVLGNSMGYWGTALSSRLNDLVRSSFLHKISMPYFSGNSAICL